MANLTGLEIDGKPMSITNESVEVEPTPFEYYYRRGNRYYFRSSDKKLSLTCMTNPSLTRGKVYNLQIDCNNNYKNMD